MICPGTRPCFWRDPAGRLPPRVLPTHLEPLSSQENAKTSLSVPTRSSSISIPNPGRVGSGIAPPAVGPQRRAGADPQHHRDDDARDEQHGPGGGEPVELVGRERHRLALWCPHREPGPFEGQRGSLQRVLDTRDHGQGEQPDDHQVGREGTEDVDAGRSGENAGRAGASWCQGSATGRLDIGAGRVFRAARLPEPSQEQNGSGRGQCRDYVHELDRAEGRDRVLRDGERHTGHRRRGPHLAHPPGAVEHHEQQHRDEECEHRNEVGGGLTQRVRRNPGDLAERNDRQSDTAPRHRHGVRDHRNRHRPHGRQSERHQHHRTDRHRRPEAGQRLHRCFTGWPCRPATAPPPRNYRRSSNRRCSAPREPIRDPRVAYGPSGSARSRAGWAAGVVPASR
ncbi:Parallel beta-helix repeat protein [Streptomyces rapamycinicus NRRL 5491]|uniref:Parallel beta-helix repeat protein n=1 Tax=Streptomyces rapamycinicus (strain ATCC 29253 / DSM 41530 / NRRL 5491 / AYB-994) TaxID=1343740 RepID=A0A3L8R3X9_STRRN|nr:Parallel beta-helix repeat protein [Streptomyces rapamycinicus NRRL 5491]